MSSPATPRPTDDAPTPSPGPAAGPTIGPSERLSATLALSLIAFGVVILGIGFAHEDAAPVVPTLDVILTQTTTPEPPKQADFIAQANNQGGGDRDKAMRPRDPQMGLDPKPQPGVAPQPMTAQAPPPAPEPEQRMLTTTVHSDRAVPLPEEQPNSPPAPLPTGRELVQRSLERARLAAEMERQQELYAKRPKRKFISASTQQYEYAAYMRAWVEKVERVGNLNCPSNVCTPGLVGSLIMTVVLRPDGTIAEITITTPSGIKALDQAAIKAVRLAQPFAPIPKTSERVDELFITRTWLLNDGSLDTK